MVNHPSATQSTSSSPFPAYPSALSDLEWAMVAPLLPQPCQRGRPRYWSLRLIIDTLFYLLRAGCPWRFLPQEYPPWGTVYYYFREWQRTGRWHRIHDALRKRVPLTGPPRPGSLGGHHRQPECEDYRRIQHNQGL